MQETEQRHVTPGMQPSFTAPYKAVFTQGKASTFFGRYLYPSSLNQNLRYHPSSGGSLVGRATYAASRIFVTRDESGKGGMNTSYLLRALTSVAADTASRPYWRRSFGEPFSDFGSTVGNDAGRNLFHEFGTGIRQVLKGHAPKFVSRIGESITNHQAPREIAFTSAR